MEKERKKQTGTGVTFVFRAPAKKEELQENLRVSGKERAGPLSNTTKD